MPEFKCKKCGKCLSSKQALTLHINKKKPCSSSNVKTKHQCKRCFKYLNSKQKLNYHINRKNKCEIYKHIPVVKSEYVKEMDLIEDKKIMLTAMKKEYSKELIKLYKLYGTKIECRLKQKAILDKKFKINIKKLEERKSIPGKMYSIIPDKKEQIDTVENLVKYYKLLKSRIAKAEKRFSDLEDEQDDSMLGLKKILLSTSKDREKLLSIKKELYKQVGRNALRVITHCEEDITDA